MYAAAKVTKTTTTTTFTTTTTTKTMRKRQLQSLATALVSFTCLMAVITLRQTQTDNIEEGKTIFLLASYQEETIIMSG